MIADRDNNRVIIVSPTKQIVWRFPTARAHGSGAQLSQPDDAFVSADGKYITINQEFAETVGLITLTRHPRLVWRYGHPGVQGSAPGYLAHPDDAYLLANGQRSGFATSSTTGCARHRRSGRIERARPNCQLLTIRARGRVHRAGRAIIAFASARVCDLVVSRLRSRAYSAAFRRARRPRRARTHGPMSVREVRRGSSETVLLFI